MRRSSSKDRRPPVSGLWQWEYNGETAAMPRTLFGRTPASAVVGDWERQNRGPGARVFFQTIGLIKRHASKLGALMLAFVVGAVLASGPNSTAANWQLRDKLRRSDAKLVARQGELELVRMEVLRLNEIMDHSRRYKIPADLAAAIYDIARSEGIDPKIAFALVSVESEFSRKAISPVGAVGLTQLMPATARILQPGITKSDLFDHETNLRIGFRFLRDMIDYYKGDISLALTAYNRGPTIVDRIRKKGDDPSNGYADFVIGGGRSQ